MYNKLNIKNIIKIFLVFLLTINFLNAENLSCGTKNGEDRYNCQVKRYCKPYKLDEIHYKTTDYFENKEIGNDNLFQEAKKTYRKNQNNIYKCAIIKLQKNSYELIFKKLIENDKTGTLKSRILQKFKIKLKKLNKISEKEGCIFPENKEEGNATQFKQLILKESAYEYCKYNYYLNYLQNHYKNIENANTEYLGKNKKNTFKISQIANIQSKLQQDILDEKNHSSKVFSLVFETYIDYENNYPVHILLELIKEDFIVLRRKLHEAISPLTQVVYKISNAMSIN